MSHFVLALAALATIQAGASYGSTSYSRSHASQ